MKHDSARSQTGLATLSSDPVLKYIKMRQADTYRDFLYEKCTENREKDTANQESKESSTTKFNRRKLRVSFREDTEESVSLMSDDVTYQHAEQDGDKVTSRESNMEKIPISIYLEDDGISISTPRSLEKGQISTLSPSDAITNDVTLPPFGRKRPPKLSRIKAVQSLDFDQLFEHPDQFSASIRRQNFNGYYNTVESVDEGIASLDIEDYNGSARDVNVISKTSRQPSVFSISDSVQLLTLPQILERNIEASKGFSGFRRRVGNDINFKYCSFCRCDEVLFLFLYTVFGIVYISAGCLGLLNCSSELFVNMYLIVDGALSIFIFPTTIMGWSKRIGGCLNEDEKLGSGMFFVSVLVLRTTAGVIGTVILAMRLEHIPTDDVMCLTVSTLLKVGVVLEWTFLLFAIILPTFMYTIMYCYAKRAHRQIQQKHIQS